MSTSDLPPIPPTIAQFTGPLLLGLFANWALFGALTVQVYVYYLAFPRDGIYSKSIVGFVYVLELVQTILVTRDGFRNFATGWGNMLALAEIGWIWFSVPVMSAVISCIVQLFFAWRIWILSQRLVIPGLIAMLSVMQCVAGIWAGVHAHFIKDFSKIQKLDNKPTSLWLGGTVLCDIIIAIGMIYYLTKSRTGLRSTNAFVAKLVRLIIETGLLCAAFAVLDLILFYAFQHNNYHLAPSLALSKLYSNSLLVVFNSRLRFVNGRNCPTTCEEPVSLMSFDWSSTIERGSEGTSTMNQDHKHPAQPDITRGINVSISRQSHDDSGFDIPIVTPANFLRDSRSSDLKENESEK